MVINPFHSLEIIIGGKKKNIFCKKACRKKEPGSMIHIKPLHGSNPDVTKSVATIGKKVSTVVRPK